jgi:hypothetical protein
MRPAAFYDPYWVDRAVDVIARIAVTTGRVTADDLRKDQTIQEPESAQQIGVAFRVARQRGLLEPVAYAASRTRSRRGGARHEWAPTSAARFQYPEMA